MLVESGLSATVASDFDAVLPSGLGVWPVSWLARDLLQHGVASRVVSVEYNGNLLVGEHAHPPRSLDELAETLLGQLHAAG